MELVLFRCVSVKLKRQLRNGEWSNSEKKSEKRKSDRSGRRPYTKLCQSNITNQSLLFLQVRRILLLKSKVTNICFYGCHITSVAVFSPIKFTRDETGILFMENALIYDSQKQGRRNTIARFDF